MTITYNVRRQEKKSWGVDVTSDFHDEETKTTRTCTFRFDDFPSDTELSARMNHKIYHIHFDLNPLNQIDLGENFKDVFIDLVKYIRNHPNCTFNQLKTAAATKYPDLFWKADKLIDWIKAQLGSRLGFVPTFAQFKTYIINHKFLGVD